MNTRQVDASSFSEVQPKPMVAASMSSDDEAKRLSDVLAVSLFWLQHFETLRVTRIHKGLMQVPNATQGRLSTRETH